MQTPHRKHEGMEPATLLAMLHCALGFRLNHQERLRLRPAAYLSASPESKLSNYHEEKTNRHYPRRLLREDVLFHFRHDSCMTRLKQLARKVGENEGKKTKNLCFFANLQFWGNMLVLQFLPLTSMALRKPLKVLQS